MKKWLATAAMIAAPHLASAQEHEDHEGHDTATDTATEEVDHPTSEKHAGKHDHRFHLPTQTHVRIEVLGSITDKKLRKATVKWR